MAEELEAHSGSIELAITPVMDLKTAQDRLAKFQEFIKGYMVEGEDFGIIPGTPKPTLLKPGADKLCEIYGLSDEYEIVPEQSREDWDRTPALFDYTVRCILKSKRTGGLVATGMGSCNSYEGKYRWRDLKRTCPECGQPAIIKGKAEYGGGYICWKKEGKSNGCGAKFADDDERITKQLIGKTENDDIATLKNTILKMAKKRSKVDATLSATRSSGIFTQDLEDIKDAMPQAGETQPAHSIQQPQRESEKTIQLVSDAEREEIFRLAKACGFPNKDEVSRFLLGQFGCKRTAEVTAAQYPKVLDAIRAWAGPVASKDEPKGKAGRKKKEPEGPQAAEPAPAESAPKGNGKKDALLSDQQKGQIWAMAKTYLWSKGSGDPQDPLHVFLMKDPLRCDSVANIPAWAVEAVKTQLQKGPQSVGLKPVKSNEPTAE